MSSPGAGRGTTWRPAAFDVSASAGFPGPAGRRGGGRVPGCGAPHRPRSRRLRGIPALVGDAGHIGAPSELDCRSAPARRDFCRKRHGGREARRPLQGPRYRGPRVRRHPWRRQRRHPLRDDLPDSVEHRAGLRDHRLPAQAAVLDEMMKVPARARPPVRSLLVPPKDVIERESTRVYACEDPLVEKAMRFIRRYGTGHLTVGGILAAVPASRRSLETRFKKATGRTLRAEIVRVRLAHARALLRTTNLRWGTWQPSAGSALPSASTRHSVRPRGSLPAATAAARGAARRAALRGS